MTPGKMVGSLSTPVDAPLIDEENNVSIENFQSMDEEDEPIFFPLKLKQSLLQARKQQTWLQIWTLLDLTVLNLLLLQNIS